MTIALYKFSLVGKWHQNPFCTGMTVIDSKVVTAHVFTGMNINGGICRKCKGPARASK